MAQSYTGPIFSGQPDWARVPIARLESAGGGNFCAYVVV